MRVSEKRGGLVGKTWGTILESSGEQPVCEWDSCGLVAGRCSPGLEKRAPVRGMPRNASGGSAASFGCFPALGSRAEPLCVREKVSYCTVGVFPFESAGTLCAREARAACVDAVGPQAGPA